MNTFDELKDYMNAERIKGLCVMSEKGNKESALALERWDFLQALVIRKELLEADVVTVNDSITRQQAAEAIAELERHQAQSPSQHEEGRKP